MMKKNAPIKVEFALPFERQLLMLAKKYRHIRIDVEPFINQLLLGHFIGDQIKGTGYVVYKTRIKNSDIQKGKSGGYRLIYYLKSSAHIILIAIYSKSEQSDIASNEIRRIINKC